MDINKHINGCGLVWTNHTESAPSMGTKALHDNLAWTARSGLPRSSHGIGAETPVRRGRSRTQAVTPAPSATNTRLGTKGGASPALACDPLIASCEASGLVEPRVVVTVDPKHALFFDGVYEPPRAAPQIAGPVHAARGSSSRSAGARDSPQLDRSVAACRARPSPA